MSYIDFHPTIHEMGDEECLAAIISGDITEFEDLSLTTAKNILLSRSPYLSRVSMPLLSSVSISLFFDCGSLTEVNVPMTRYIYGESFGNCASLKLLAFNYLDGDIKIRAFMNTSLETLILRNIKTVVTLSNINAFENTPIASGAGYIYVPKKMLDGSDGIAAYEAATNWSTFSGQFRYIEDYREITGG